MLVPIRNAIDMMIAAKVVKKDQCPIIPGTKYVEIYENLHEFLIPFHEASLQMQNSDIMVSKVYIMDKELQSHLNTWKKFENSENDELTLQENLKEIWDERLNERSMGESVCSYLDLAARDYLSESGKKDIQLYIIETHGKQFPDLTLNPLVDVPLKVFKSKLFKLHQNENSDVNWNIFQYYEKKYGSIQQLDEKEKLNNQGTLNFWKFNVDPKIHSLKILASQYLSIVAGASDVEHFWSIGSRISCDPKRNSSLPNKIAKTLYLNANQFILDSHFNLNK
jgi:hypothetical protein